MTALQAIVLGVVQGVTEFLPVSSSAHLILGSKLLGWEDQGLHFDMAAHTGSLGAVVLYLRSDLSALGRGLTARLRGVRSAESTAAIQVLLASLPVAVVGLLLQGFVAADGRSLGMLGATSLGFGLLLAWADRRTATAVNASGWSRRQVAAVGLAQALAVIPGTSRSGVTMTAGLFSGMSRSEATRLSFILAVPVGVMVAIKDLWDLAGDPSVPIDISGLLLGTVAAAISAYFAIDWLLTWVRRHGFVGFAIYRMVLGLVLLGLAAG